MTRILALLLSADATAVHDSSTETVATTAKIEAGAYQKGKVFSWKGHARATATVSTDTLTAKLYHHTTTSVASGTAIGATAAVDVADNDVVDWDLELIPQSAPGSTSGSVLVRGTMTSLGAEGTVTSRAVHEILTGVDYTADHYVGLTLKWSTTNANSAIAEASTLTEIC